VIDWELLIETGLLDWLWKFGVIYGSYKWGRIVGETANGKYEIDIEGEKPTIPLLIPLWVKGSAFLAGLTYIFYGWGAETGMSFIFIFDPEEVSPFLGILVVLLCTFFIGYYDSGGFRKGTGSLGK